MCGITGFWGPATSAAEALRETVTRMADQIAYRGPDAAGTWVDPSVGLALGHRRLSILDLSEAGAQPMTSSCGRIVLTYNGEVYNFQEIRTELEQRGRSFRGHSDTEVLVEGIAEWGVNAMLQKAIGMFALAAWDQRDRTLTLARDRLGIKPLYYGQCGDTVLFGSELKALRTHPTFNAGINRDAIAQLLQHCYIPGPHSIYQNVHKLTPGTLLTIKQPASSLPSPEVYWQLSDHAHPRSASSSLNIEAERERLDELLTDAVRLRMISDVPYGAFLSGGIDSSLVVALMQKQAAEPVKTFSIGFQEQQYNEAHYAKAVAEHLKTDHTELYVEPKHALEVIPRLPQLYDEPFADSSQIPTYLVSELTRKSVTVSLSGDGGDESFCGYRRYRYARDVWNILRLVPKPMRQLSAIIGTGGMQVAPSKLAKKIFRRVARIGIQSAGNLYCAQLLHWTNAADIVLGAKSVPTLASDPSGWPTSLKPVERFMYADTLTYLPDDILTKVDRASMAVSLEARVPLLDHRVVEYAWSLPIDLRLRSGTGKWLLREVLAQYVPRELFERRKMGFGVPIDHWLRGPLQDWAEALIDERRLREEGYFDPQPIRTMWAEHLSGKTDWQYPLWDVLMFQAWLEAQ
ncbi:asparagine synthase (glutamine-hydrolyzing) [Calycomorphotria hydatis]|uniref:asparagine synthase (glutamine-hydrolyzing) n=1 Tax=Calycomorphotria hydatis TaxID=2528027 RepID=A0A517T9Q0_9PLAN|nr:asparagine synthase (glutamine-hydrolyzing) [Calycomorphotria hydatis]QDT65104.1 Asparagine synthetase [glutamine-hydrolyzing] 1 [Calycomorphotria hydatis]